MREYIKHVLYVYMYCMHVCYRSDGISRRVVGPSTYIPSAHTDGVRLALQQWLRIIQSMYVCMYVCMREYGQRNKVGPQVGNDPSGQGDLLIDILQVNLKGSYRQATCMYACMYENDYVNNTM